MPAAHPNLHKIPDIVERPIPQTMRNLLSWNFKWEVVPVPFTDHERKDVQATLATDEGVIVVKWFQADDTDHWYVGKVICPNGFWPNGERRPGPTTTKGVQRWLNSYDERASAAASKAS